MAQHISISECTDSPSQIKSVCKHCETLCLDDSDFCCTGCEVVWNALHELGLEDFYKYRKTGLVAPARPIKVNRNNFLHFDLALKNQKLALVHKDATISVVLGLDGIHCAGCVWLLEKLPSVCNGIKSSEVNLVSGRIRVHFDPVQTQLSTIAATISKLGYTPLLISDQQAETKQSKEEHTLLVRIGIAGFSAMNTMMLAVSLWQGFFTGIPPTVGNFFRWVSLLLAIPAITYCAFPFYRNAITALRVRALHIDLPISLALIGAFTFSVINTLLGREYVYFDSVTALTFLLLLGRYIQARALKKARETSLFSWEYLPAYAYSISGEAIPIQELQIESEIRIAAGERVPADGVVIKGTSSIDRSILTGESLPVLVSIGDQVNAGELNNESVIQIRVTAVGENSRLGKIVAQIRDGSLSRSPILSLVDWVSGYFVFCILSAALITFSYWYLEAGALIAMDNAVALLIVTCPCALGLATPSALTVAIGKASKAGILLRGADTVERLAQVKEIYFDKTGTLTKGELIVASNSLTEDRSIILSSLKGLSQIAPHHPASRAISKWCDADHESQKLNFLTTRYYPGKGSEGRDVNGITWKLGSLSWLGDYINNNDLVDPLLKSGLMPLLFVREHRVLGVFGLSDELRPEAKEVVSRLQSKNRNLFILSGDLKRVVDRVAHDLSIPNERALAELFPEDKSTTIRKSANTTAMVGDGVNDSLAMKCANVSIAVRGGIESLLEVADVFIANGSLKRVVQAFDGADRTLSLIKKNLLISAFYNIAGGFLAIGGYINPLIAAILMPISSFSVILYSIWARTFEDQ